MQERAREISCPSGCPLQASNKGPAVLSGKVNTDGILWNGERPYPIWSQLMR